MPTPEEYLQSLRDRRGTTSPTQGRLVAKKSDKSSKVGKFVKAATSPLYDPPDIPFAPGFVNRGIASATSPLGIAATLAAPVTGGSSLGLGSILAREAALSVGTGIAGEFGAEQGAKYQGPGAGLVHVAAPLAAAVLTGQVGARGLGGKSSVSRIKQLEVADKLTDPSTITDPIDKIAYYIRNSEPSTEANELLRGAERSKRVGSLSKVFKEEGFTRESLPHALSTLRGELPDVRFAPTAMRLTPEEFNTVMARIDNSGLQALDKLTTFKSLLDVVDHGSMPTISETKLLARVYGEDFVASILKHRTKPEIWRQAAFDVIGLPRAIKASWDASFPLRQGIVLGASHPREFFGAWKPMLKSLTDDNYAIKVMQEIKDDPMYKTLTELGLDLRDLSTITLAANPEEFFVRVPKYLQGSALGAGIKASERAYTVAGNKMLFDTMKHVYKQWEEIGPSALKQRNLEDMAEFFNFAVGRGKLPKDLSRLSPALNAGLFAPRFLYSRFGLAGAPFKRMMTLAKADPDLVKNPGKLAALYMSDPVLREMGKTLGAFVITGGAILSLSKLTGHDVETNPRSANFGRLQFGDTKIDIWGGYQPLARYATQIIYGERKTGADNITDASRWDTAGRFIRSKESPVVGFIHDLIKGQTFLGDEVRGDPDSIALQLANALSPLFLADAANIIKQEGYAGVPAAGLAFFGAGVQSYSSVRDQQNLVAKELYGKESYRELTAPQQDAVNADQRVVDQELKDSARKNKYGTAHEDIVQNRMDSEGLLYASLEMGMSRKDFADSLARVQRDAFVEDKKAQELLGINFPPPNTPLATMLDSWYGLYDKADYGVLAGGNPTGAINWDLYHELEESFMSGLTPEEKTYIKDRRKATHNEAVNWFYEAKDYIDNKGYNDTVDTSFKKFRSQAQAIVPRANSKGDLAVAYERSIRTNPQEAKRIKQLINKIDADASKKKEALRKSDPKLDWALFETGRTDVFKTNRLTKSPFRSII